jgi:hypothetical protein
MDSVAPTVAAPPFVLRAFMGTWHVAATTLKLWKTGGRCNPAITYHLDSDEAGAGLNPPPRWRDTVRCVLGRQGDWCCVAGAQRLSLVAI